MLFTGLPSTGGTISAGASKAPQPVAAGGGPPSDADADLEARLENLRRQWLWFIYKNSYVNKQRNIRVWSVYHFQMYCHITGIRHMVYKNYVRERESAI